MSPASPPNAALLQPSLATAAAAAPLLSPRATFLTSFFGGPCAAVAVGTINLVRLRRARRDAWVVAVAVLLAIASLAITFVGVGWPELRSAYLPGSLARRANNVLGIAAWALFYLRLRPEYRAAELTDGFARPWVACLASLAAALALTFVAGFAGAFAAALVGPGAP